MLQNQRSPGPKSSEYQETGHVSPNANIRHVNSSEGYRQRSEYNKSSSRNYIMSDQSTLDNNNQGPEVRHFSAHSPPKYRITTSTGPLRSAGPKLKNREIKGVDDIKTNDPLEVVQNIRGINSAEKELYRGGLKYMTIEKERLYGEWLHLKKQVNTIQEENIKLKTRNTHLEKEATKFEKMFQEVATNPKMQKKLMKAEEGNVPNLKQHLKDIKNELEDKNSELKGLKKKAKVTKVNELEVQVQAFQEEILRLRSYADNIIAQKTAKIIQEGERRLVEAQNAERARLTKEIEATRAVNQKYEQSCQDYQNQIASKDEKQKKDQVQTNQVIQTKEKEIAQLKSQLVGFTANAAALAVLGSNKKPSANTAADAKMRKDLEQKALENHDLKVSIEEKDEQISEFEKRIKEAETKLIEAEKARAAEEEVKKAIKSPSYSSNPIKEHEKKKEASPKIQAKENNPVQQKIAVEPKEKKVSLEEAQKIGAQINSSFQAKGASFKDLEKLEWKKNEQNDVTRDQITAILRKELFGLSEKEIPTLTQYLLQETNGKDNKTHDIQGLVNTLKVLIGSLPNRDEEVRKKSDHGISKANQETHKTPEKREIKNVESEGKAPVSDSKLHKGEKEEKIQKKELDVEKHKLSDEEDDDEENYEYLFPPEGKKTSERISERGEEEEDDEEYKDDDEFKENEKDIPERKKKDEAKQEKELPKSKPQEKKEEEEDEYQDEEYEEEADEDKTKAKSKEIKEKSQTESVIKSSQNELAKSEAFSSNRSSNQKQAVSPRQNSQASEKSIKDAERKASDVSEKYESDNVKSNKSLETKEKVKAKEPVDDNYDEEFEEEFEVEDTEK